MKPSPCRFLPVFALLLVLSSGGRIEAGHELGQCLFPNPAYPYGVSNSPNGQAIADFDNDGNPDLAVPVSSGVVLIFRGSVNGTFILDQTVSVPVGSGARDIGVGDLDADGNADLVTADNGSNAIFVLLGNGDGTFQRETTFAVGSSPRNVAVGDVDADGILDIAVTNVASDDISVLLGLGDGGFSPQMRFPAGDDPGRVVMGDLDDDGVVDLAIVNGIPAQISVLPGTGGGQFGPRIFSSTAVGGTALVLGQFDGDGDLDAAVSAVQGIVILRGYGDGTFRFPFLINTGGGYGGIDKGDFNGDGNLDLAVAQKGADEIAVLLGDGIGGFFLGHYLAGALPVSVAVGDLNRDGFEDLASVSLAPNLSTLFGKGDGTFNSRVRTRGGLVGAVSVAAEDFDLDGYTDLAIATGDAVVVLSGQGDGSFGAPVPFDVGERPASVAAGDLDGDGILDLAVANSAVNSALPGDISVLPGNGDGTFGPDTRFAAGITPMAIRMADLDQDGNLDLAVANKDSDDVSVLLGTGTGSFGPQLRIPVGDAPRALVIGDFNSDSINDLAVANRSSGDVSVLPGNGDGTFGPEVRFPSTGFSPVSIAAGDFDADGIPDLAVANEGSSSVTVAFGDGAGNFPTEIDLEAEDSPSSVSAGDFDGDGRIDLVTVSGYGGEASVFLSLGSRRFTDQILFGAGVYDSFVGIADFNNDQRPDLVVADGPDNSISVLPNLGICPNAPPIERLCELTPSRINLQSSGTTFSIHSTLTNLLTGDPLDMSLLPPVYISRVSSPSVGDIVLPVPRAEPGCDDFTEDGIWETVEDRSYPGQGGATLRFDNPSDGQCETRDGNRQDIIALMLDIPTGETATICYQGLFPGLPDPIECCGTTQVTNQGNR